MKKAKKKLRSQADKLWYEKCKEKRPCCEVCGEQKNVMQVHHFYYKSSYGHLRYADDNAITLCRKCHFILHHQDPKKIEDIIIENRGNKWLNKLKKRAYDKPTSSYLTVSYYLDIISKLSK